MLSVKIRREYRGFPIEVEGNLNELGQIDLVKEIFDEIIRTVDGYHETQNLRHLRARRKARRIAELTRYSQEAMSHAGTFLFNLEGETKT